MTGRSNGSTDDSVLDGNVLRFLDCDDATCGSGTATTVDGTSVGRRTGIYNALSGPTESSCRIAYFTQTTQSLMLKSCQNADCTQGVIVAVDGTPSCYLANCSTSDHRGQFASIDCPAADDCKIAYYDGTNFDLMMAD